MVTARERIAANKAAKAAAESKTGADIPLAEPVEKAPLATRRPTKSKPVVFARMEDGTPMPMGELPEMDMTDIEQRMLDAMTVVSSDDSIPAMGMIYGDVGTQKTTKAFAIMQGIIPVGKKIVYVDSAAGWTTLMNYPHLMRDSDGVPNVLKFDYQNIETLWALAKAIKIGKGEYANVAGVIFDEYTQMHDMDLNWITDVRANLAANEGEFKDRYTPTWPEYNAARTRSNRVLELFMLSKVHLIFVGHSKVTKKMETVPDMPEKAGKSLYAKLHFAYLTKFNDKGIAVMQTSGSKREMAKNRINGIAAQSSPEEFIARYKVWGKEDKVTKVSPKPIEAEPIPDEDDLEAMLN